MGRSRYKFNESAAPYFLTDTIVNWYPVFTAPQTVQIILDSFAWMQQQHDLKLLGCVVMENHIHWIAQHEQLPVLVKRFKSFTAREIINHLKSSGQQRILEELSFRKKGHKTDSQYQLWQEGSHPQSLESLEILNDMLDYIHLNPVKRGYIDDPLHWRYSSARNFEDLPALLDIYKSW